MKKFFKDFFKSPVIQICLGICFISPLGMFILHGNECTIIDYFKLAGFLFITTFGFIAILLIIDELVYRYKIKNNSKKQ